MREWVFIPCAAGLLALAASSQHARDPLTALDVAVLLETGMPAAEVVALAEDRGVALRWSARVAAGLSARGLGPRQVARLRRAAVGPASPSGKEVFFDATTGVTWALPVGWTGRDRDGELVFVLEDAAPGVTAEIRARSLVLDVADLRRRGITALNDYHRLRIEEIVAGEGATWTHHGSWSLAAVGWSGVHAVFEEAGRTTRLTTCLTWFSHGDRLLSISTRIEDPLGNPTHDAVVDDVTAILTGHAPFAAGAAALARHARDARSERLILVDGDGAVASWNRRNQRTVELLPPGHDRVAAATSGYLFTARGGLVEHHRRTREGWSDPRPLHRAGGPVLALDADPLGGGFSLLTRSMDGEPVALSMDMRGEEIASDTSAESVRLGRGMIHVGAVSVRLPGATELRHRADARGLLVLAGRLAGESSEIVALGAFPSAACSPPGVDSGPAIRLRELARAPLAPDDEKSALEVLWGAGGEVYFVAPGAGLCSIPRAGGLPVRLVEPGAVRDACVVP